MTRLLPTLALALLLGCGDDGGPAEDASVPDAEIIAEDAGAHAGAADAGLRMCSGLAVGDACPGEEGQWCVGRWICPCERCGPRRECLCIEGEWRCSYPNLGCAPDAG